MADRIGPTLTLAASCEGCRWLLSGVRDPALVGRHSACTHPTRNDGGTIFARSSKAPTMPEWCPELPGARLAMAREIATGAVDDAPVVGSGIPSRGETAECGPGPGAPIYATDIERAKCMFRARLTLQRIERERREASRVYVETADDDRAREAQKESE